MRRPLLTSVATAALLAGLAAAGAQQDQGRRGEPSASEQTQPPRVRNNVKEWPGVQAQQPERQAPRAEPEKSTTGQSSERPADQPRLQRERIGEDRSPARERPATGQSQERATMPSSGEARRDTSDTTRRGEAQRLDTAQDRGSRAERRNQSTVRGPAALSDEQRTRVATRFSASIDRMNVRPLSRAQISVSVGAAIPRSVRVYTVPSDIVAVYPQFRGHRFVVVDDEIVIVEPRSYRVVTVLPMGGERRMARSRPVETTGSAAAAPRVRISPQIREEIRTVVMREPACRLEQRVDFFLFIPLPRTVEVCELPPQIVTGTPELRGYRYVVRGEEIGLVDPDDNQIVEVIR